VTDWLGVLHDPDVVLTDVGLAGLGAYLGWRLWSAAGGESLRRIGAVLMASLASAALWGAVFHAFFPGGTATPAGRLAWIPVSLSIVAASATMLSLALRILAPNLSAQLRRYVVMAYAGSFVGVVILVDNSYASIVHFYLPALLLLLIAAGQQLIRQRSRGWTLVTTGLLVSTVAALLQQLRISIHPVYFDHNAVYHVVQGTALVVLYFGWRRAREPLAPPHLRASGRPTGA
jgi:uncharacterized protein DUF6962